MVFPTLFRAQLEKFDNRRLFVTFDGGHLLLFPESNWETVAQRLQDLMRRGNGAVKEHCRRILNNTDNIEPDQNGRAMLPPQLLEQMAFADKELIMAGNGESLEIMSAAAWAARQSEGADAGADLEAAYAGLGLEMPL